MPCGDQTGTSGWGPRTGRGAGYCAGYDAPGFANWPPGRHFGRAPGRDWCGGWTPGRGGGGRGWRHRFFATRLPGWVRYAHPYEPAWGYPPPPSQEQELEGLKREAEWLKGQLDTVNQCIEELGEE